MQLCNALGLSPSQFTDVRPFRVRKSPCSCSNGCSTSGKVELCVTSRGEPVRKGRLARDRGPRLVRSYALTASQAGVFGGGLLGEQPVLVRPGGLRDMLKHALAYFVVLATKAVAVVAHFVRLFMLDFERIIEKQEGNALGLQQSEAAEVATTSSRVEAAVLERRDRAMAMMREAKDAAFHQMLKCMDDTSFNLEEKWTLILRHTGKAEFSQHIRTLFAAAGKSSTEVQTRALDSSQMWKSATTQEVIAQEAALKRIVFQQMLLQGGSA
eukprot:jgi/Botrbrau1/14928/Bobra.0018s0032.1